MLRVSPPKTPQALRWVYSTLRAMRAQPANEPAARPGHSGQSRQSCRHAMSEENMNAKNDTGDCHSRCLRQVSCPSHGLNVSQAARIAGLTHAGVPSWE